MTVELERVYKLQPSGSWGWSTEEAVGGGGSQPTTREMFDANTVVADSVRTYLTWTKAGFAGGDDLVDLTDPLGPTIITAGVYALSGWVSVSAPADGSYLFLDLEIDADNDDADGINTAAIIPGLAVSNCGTSITYYSPAGGVLRAGSQHDITAGAIVTFKARLQRIA
jgi:hypothetical protein